MGQQLAAAFPVFAEAMGECERALAPFVSWSLWEVLDDAAALERVDVVQPVLWAVMVSLAALWRSVGVEPGAVVGHSQGEIAAAVVAGALSLSDGAKVVALRSRLVAQSAPRGGMVTVGLSEAAVASDLADPRFGGVSVAAVNGPASVVVSGDVEGLGLVAALWEERGVWHRWVPVDYASHSAQMQVLEESLGEVLAGIGWRAAAGAVLFVGDRRCGRYRHPGWAVLVRQFAGHGAVRRGDGAVAHGGVSRVRGGQCASGVDGCGGGCR